VCRYRLRFQADGNLVLSRYSSIWGNGVKCSSGTWNAPAQYACMQADGNFVIYKTTTSPWKATWNTGTYNHAGALLVMQDDGNLVVYQGSQGLWNSGTSEHFGPLQVPPSTTRYVYSSVNEFVDLGLITNFDVPHSNLWYGDYDQTHEPHPNYCGPTAGKNLLSWYGLDVGYDVIGGQMKTNNWDEAAAIGPACGAACAWNPFCAIPCTYTVRDNLKLGTLPKDMAATLQARTPPGYKLVVSSGNANVTAIINSLRDGNPVVYLESGGWYNLHWAVVNGVYQNAGDTEQTLRTINTADKKISRFLNDWAFAPAGDDFIRGILKQFGVVPYTMMYYQKS
jgi:hypothetical protein